MTTPLDRFFQTFVRPPKGRTPEDILAKLRHYIDVANHPERHVDDDSPFAIRVKRRNARQAIRRIVQHHPDIAAQMVQTAATGTE